MGLLQMSLSGAVMIMAIIIIRALAINRLPKKTFLILWGIVLLRLMVPFSIPSALSVYSLAERNGAWITLGQILSGQVMFAGNSGNGAYVSSDGKAQADNSVYANTEQGDNTPGENVTTPQWDSGELVRGIQNLNGDESDQHAVSGSENPEDSDSRVASGRGNSENSDLHTVSNSGNPENGDLRVASGSENPEDSNPHAVSGSGNLENDNRVTINGRGQLGYETNKEVISDTGKWSTNANDTDVSSDTEKQLKYKNDTGVSSSQPLLKAITYVWERIRRLKPLYLAIWCAGMFICATCFAASYLRSWLKFQESIPVEDAFVQKWVEEHACRRFVQKWVEEHACRRLVQKWVEENTCRRLVRKWVQECTCHRPVSAITTHNTRMQEWLKPHPRRLSVRQSDRVSTPLTYGIFHPVILMPKNTDWSNRQQLQYVLMHEYVHIRRHDTLTKLLVTCALCVHWFSPMVWMMWVLFNRDVELSCDESVLRHMGEASKAAYARMLIQMEAERSGIAPLCSGLRFRIGKNAMEERITAIMKTKKRSIMAVIAAVVLVISVTTTFATSAAEKKNTQTKSIPNTNFTEQEYEMLLALRFDGYEDMSISAYRNKVWALTDTQEYNDLIERFFQDETIYAKYETAKGTDSDETADFLYNVLSPIMSGRQAISFNGYVVTDFSSASENASLEYTCTLTILDADQLTVGEYLSARHGIAEDMENCLQGLSVSELRDEELMKVFIDETVLNITMTYGNGLTRTDIESAIESEIEYVYRPISGVAIDEMEDFQKERRDGWDKLMAPYVPFGLTYRYDWDTDDYKMFFNGKEVRGIYDEEENVWISEHQGIGEGIYAADAVELFVVYESHKIVGLREATAQEMAEITARRQAVTDGQQDEIQEIRRTVPATMEDYQSLFALKTLDYQQKSIAEFNMEYLDWCNENYERMERIGEDRGWDNYRIVLTDEEKSFVGLTTWFSGMENAAYVRSINKKEPERDISGSVRLSDKEKYAQDICIEWCVLDYGFSYHIADKEKVSIGERDSQIGKMMREIQDYWESADIDEIVQMTESEMLEWLHSIAAKYSSRNITITILDDQTQFECKDERDVQGDGVAAR